MTTALFTEKYQLVVEGEEVEKEMFEGDLALVEVREVGEVEKVAVTAERERMEEVMGRGELVRAVILLV
ncbi:hypothetical protein CEUSTIGMA_g13963.t1 [Chlamydomonas eustigma]|uniref:Uncharacterized protein n=1 Tax=Chlamydomonas eustigma TaxID=1157962 RepID=A0A250XU47_9CHLO|nr:hypothetical protein CEUSTIGMA_g13963.t1 [Chlamydomonas eustigma]|eukprot:GAX86556.1 hypothetical protein CEUSTIGMA_g13963.t1 [Chlamydomonas eustigma]